MPLHDDEMNRRREKREAMRKKREAEARRLRLRLILTALVLAVCVGGIALLVSKRQELGIGPSEPPTTQKVVETTQATSPIHADPITSIHIRAAGDLNITDRVVKSGVAAMGYDFGPAFRDVAALMAEADLTVLNFEGNVYGEPYGSATSSAPVELLHSLRNMGVDMVQMANSCAINNGLNGLGATLRAIRSAGIEPLGAYANDYERTEGKGYTMTEVQGIKVAFVAFTKGLGGRGMPAGSENLVNLLYTDYASTYQTIDEEGITKLLKTVAAEKPDLTVAMLHWGSEYNDDISRTQERIVSLMKKQGVDVIIGTHPHMVHPIDFDPIEGTLVAYSLGDFFGDASHKGTEYSLILDIEITKDSTSGVTKVTDYSYIPIYTVHPSETEGDYTYSRVMRIEKTLEAHRGNYLDKVTSACRATMENGLKRVDARVVMPEEED